MNWLLKWAHIILAPSTCEMQQTDDSPGWEEKTCKICGCRMNYQLVDMGRSKTWVMTRAPFQQ